MFNLAAGETYRRALGVGVEHLAVGELADVAHMYHVARLCGLTGPQLVILVLYATRNGLDLGLDLGNAILGSFLCLVGSLRLLFLRLLLRLRLFTSSYGLATLSLELLVQLLLLSLGQLLL